MEESKRGIPYKWIALTVIGVGAFNAGLDIGIINISLPKLREVFGVSPETVLWISLIYPLLGGSLLLTWGRLGDMVGRERIFTLGFLVSTVGLALCATAQNNATLMVFRVIQVAGLSALVSVSPAIAAAAFRTQERGRTLGIYIAVFSAGAFSGPLVGGYLLDHFAWQSIFYFRLPLAVAGLALAFSLLKRQPSAVAEHRFDIWGALILLGGLSSFIVAVNQGRMQGWTSPLVLSLGIAALALFPIFLMVERRAAQPVLDLKLFRERVFTTAVLSTTLAITGQLMLTLLMPFYLMEGVGYSASTAGMVMMIQSGVMPVMAPVSGWLGDKLSPRLLCPLGLAMTGLGLFLISGLGADTSIAGIIPLVIVNGFGFALFIPPNSSAIVGSVPLDRLGTSTAMMVTARNVGMAIGSAVGMTLFASRKLFHVAELGSQGVGVERIEHLGVVGGFHDVILVALGITVLALIVSLFMRKRPAAAQ